MSWVFLCLVGLTALSAYAADYTAGTKCPADVKHVPSIDVEYQAGINASGYAVAPAEASPPVLSADDFTEIEMPLEIAAQDYIKSGNANIPTDRMELNAGKVSVNAKSGDVSLNGKALSQGETSEYNPDCW